MLPKVTLPFLSKFLAQRTLKRLLKLRCLPRGYCANLNNRYFELVRKGICKSRILVSSEVILKSGKVEIVPNEKEELGVFSILSEIILISIRIIVITTVVFGLLSIYGITRFFGLKTFPIIYLKAIEFLGPTFIKLGQWMSTRRDLFPEELCTCLARLQRSTSAHSWYYTQHILEVAYGPNWRRMFIDFDPVPVGSGCCAQVYRAFINSAGLEACVLRRDTRPSTLVEIAETFYLGYFADFLGELFKQDTEKKHLSSSSNGFRPVAVKILHPCVKERLQRDLSILRFFSKCIICLVPSLTWLSITDCINEFSQIMEKQVDLELEAKNLMKFSRHFSSVTGISFPQPYYNLCYNQILVETFHNGRPINDYMYENNYSLRHKLAKIGLYTVFKMIFEDNFVHCDLHPGNILVEEMSDCESFELLHRSASPRIVILDCGLVTELSEVCRRNFHEVFRSVAAGDGKRAANLMMDHSVHKSPDPVGFMETMDRIVKSHLRRGVKLKNINVGHVMSELFAAMVRYQVKQDSAFSSIILSIAVIEGLGRSLDPDIDLIHELAPFVAAGKL